LHPEEHFVGLGCFCGAVRAQTDRKPVDWKAMARLLSAFRRQAVEACQGGDVIMESISPTIGIVDAVAISCQQAAGATDAGVFTEFP